jgi:hypothetical protein
MGYTRYVKKNGEWYPDDFVDDKPQDFTKLLDAPIVFVVQDREYNATALLFVNTYNHPQEAYLSEEQEEVIINA